MVPGINHPVFLSHRQISDRIVEVMLSGLGTLGKVTSFGGLRSCDPMSVDLS